jgi:hypothetical protein
MFGGLAGITGGAAMLALLPVSLGVAGYLGALAVLTAGYGLFQTANNAAVLQARPGQDRGAISGLLNLSRNVGLISGTAALGLVFRFAVGTGQIAAALPAAITRGLHVTFAVAAVVMLSAAVLVAAGQRRRADGAGRKLVRKPDKQQPAAPPV